MAQKFENISNYNAAIANESNNIGQKLFAYIAKGKNINDRIRTKFAKSLIFIGDEGQIYNPLTNTYIGIGQTAYTSTISYIEDAHEKISSLNQMLASSMVSAIYANWSQDEWTSGDVKNPLVENIANAMPSKIYATNEIILRGHGDYDPSTKLAATREYSHITDANATSGNTYNLYKHTYKTLNQVVKHKYTNTTDDQITHDGQVINGKDSVILDRKLSDGLPTGLDYQEINTASAFATSGITVNLEKGINRYLFSYTFTHKPDNGKTDIASCMNYVGQEASTEEFSKTLNLYLTKEDYGSYVTNAINGTKQNIYDNDGNKILDSANGNNVNLQRAFFWGLRGVYEDGETIPTIANDASLSDVKTAILGSLNKQLFKQAPNTLTIDDKLTWSYIASAYTYTLGFAKEYTDNQVNKIYRELLGEQSALIPATEAQVAVMIPNKDAKLNEDKFVWNETDGEWTKGNDSVNESSSNLGTFILDYSSTFVTRHTLDSTGFNAYPVKTYYTDNTYETVSKSETEFFIEDYPTARLAGDDVKVYPWNALEELADCIMTAKVNAVESWKSYTGNVPGASQYDYVMTAVDTAIKNFKYKLWDSTTNKFEDTASGQLTDVNSFDDLKNVFFMGYDKTLESYTIEEITINVGETKYLNIDYSSIEGLSTTLITDIKDVNYKKYATTNTSENPITLNYNSTGTKYTLPYIYRPVVKVEKGSDGLHINNDENNYTEETNPLFVVNTSFVSMDGINLADGIQTLKEVAYVLDMITDGWGNRYEDTEGNGILLTYTIAQNHERIEDHEKRLNAIEDGRNAVKNIYKENSSMSKYVNLHISSDTSWTSTLNSTTTPEYFKKTTADIIGLDKSKTWYGAFDTGTYVNGTSNIKYKYESLPQSYIYAYSLILSEYVNHSSGHDFNSLTIDPPTFSGLFGSHYDSLTYFVEFTYTDGITSTINDNEVATYTGQVGLGIDINVATTYTSYQYCEHDSDGYEVVDLNSSFVKKTGVCYLTVSYNISYNSDITKFTEPNSNEGSYDNPYVNNSHLRFSYADVDSLNGATYSEDGTGLLANYKTEIDNYLSTFGLEDCTLVVDGKDREYTGIDMKLWLNITGINNTQKEGYNTCIYDSDKNVLKYKYTNNTGADIVFNGSTLTSGSSIYSETQLTTVEGIIETYPIEVCVDDLGKNVYYIRKSSVKQKTVDLSSDGLTNVEWVTTYVSQVVDNVTRSIKGVEFEAYQYSRNLISQLDTSFVSSYGMYLAGIEQKDGKVSPIVRELPKDNITASTTFWGENTENSKNYTAVLSSDIEDEIAMDTPLFIQSGVEYYEVPALSSGEYYIYSKQYPGIAGDKVFITTTNNSDDPNGKYAYKMNADGEYELVGANDSIKKQCISSIKVGPTYRNFIQLYFARPAYQRIDGADLRPVITEYKYTNSTGGAIDFDGQTIPANDSVTLTDKFTGTLPNGIKETPIFSGDWKITVNSVEYSTSTTEENLKIYKLNTNTNQPQKVKQYISAQVDYQSDSTDGVGGNNFKVTAHITKLSDASENNSGLVDAYDVRNTLDSMFEWVDLSRWDEGSDEVNPINTPKNETGGNISAATRINDTKVNNAAEGKSNSLGYPIDLSKTTTEAPTSAPETTE